MPTGPINLVTDPKLIEEIRAEFELKPLEHSDSEVSEEKSKLWCLIQQFVIDQNQKYDSMENQHKS